MSHTQAIEAFLPCPTPESWLQRAVDRLEILLVDHANCEKKAASTALNLLFRHPEQYQLAQKMSRLAREELRHFEQVSRILQRRGIAYATLSASRYAAGLHELTARQGQDRLRDQLIVGAIIEARSCERFAALAPRLDEELADFYLSLLKSEARHFQDYLRLAEQVAEQNIDERVAVFLERERELIESPDPDFRFHSGVPSKTPRAVR